MKYIKDKYASYLYIVEDYKCEVYTKEIGNGIIVDFNKETNEPVGIEFLISDREIKIEEK